ncbi:MAG TPA: carboxypeptidase regulatory-like domain-containing protein, partial [Bryobacteraceae bacterium]|nr:carboxypeptidase regulatory-like domain-containing protein [Bryobacteraceae bacterium]
MSLRLILSLLFIAVIGFAQVDTGEVTGRVVSSRDNEALSLVQVQIQLAGAPADTSINTPFRAITGTDGSFHIAGVPPGNYVLQTTTVGYYLVRQEF